MSTTGLRACETMWYKLGKNKRSSIKNKGGSLTCYFDEKRILKLVRLSSCQYVSTIPEKKNCMLQTFEKPTFCQGSYEENDGPSI